jgi:TPR repeat protein
MYLYQLPFGEILSQAIHHDEVEKSNVSSFKRFKIWYEVARRYETGEGTAKDPKSAKVWYSRAFANGGLNRLKQLGNTGDIDAQYMVGRVYELGLNGVNIDFVEARKWYNKATKSGKHANALYNLGVLFEKGIGVRANKHTALRLFTDAANLEHAKAQEFIGLAFLSGEHGKKNKKKAAKWIKKAAEQGMALSQLELGDMYANGLLGSPKDALRWYKKAAELRPDGPTDATKIAAFRIGRCYDLGLNCTKKNWEAARRWYEIACSYGCGEALHRMGVFHEEETFPQSLDRAMDFYLRAARCGCADGTKAVLKIYLVC